MRTPATNLLPTDFSSELPTDRRPVSRRILRRSLRIIRTSAIVAAVAFTALAWGTRSSNPNVLIALRDSAAVRSLRSLLGSPIAVLAGERDDRVTILLLGMGGGHHEGPLLADTILLAHVQPSTRRAVLLSIPRDLLLPTPDGRSMKVNAMHAFAEAVRPGNGAIAVRDALTRVLDLPIPYHARIDFRGFVGLIDELGGVVVDVERTVDDPRYPIAGKEDAPWEERFERLVIPAGRQRMDGALTLQYVRSRQGRNGEGSDFARARRQQRLLLALRERVLDRDVLTHPRRVLALLDAWRNHVDTNLSPIELHRLAALVGATEGDHVAHIVPTDAPAGDLIAGTHDGAYVLRPRDGDYGRFRVAIERAITDNARTMPTATPTRTAALTVEVWNGTMVTGLGAHTAAALAREGLIVRAVRNAPARDVARSVIYYRQGSEVARQESMRAIVEQFQRMLHADASTAFPSFAPDPLPDILIVVGVSSLVR